MDSSINSNATVHCCCAECGSMAGEGVSLKTCKSCMLVRYCNADCQRNHWPKHKKECKLRAAEIYDEKLFKDPPPKEDCPICFLPIPMKMLSCMSLPPATTMSVPIYDFANADEEDDIMGMDMEDYYECCGKSICRGCHSSLCESGNIEKCPFCKANTYVDKADEVRVKELLKRVEANDAGSIHQLGLYHYHGLGGFMQDKGRAMELWKQSVDLGFTKAHCQLGREYRQRGDSKKAKFHTEAAAMAGHEDARHILGMMELQSGNVERAVKHWKIAASAGDYDAMHSLLWFSRNAINSTLTAYNNSCAEMRSEARDAFIQVRRIYPQVH